MSWRETKDAGKRAFSQGKHEEALELYTRAISELSATSSSTSTDGGGDGERRGGSDGGTHTTEHQILLSNVIACRLKIGGRDMSEKAVDDAKKVRFLLSRIMIMLMISRVTAEEVISNHRLVRVPDPPPTGVAMNIKSSCYDPSKSKVYVCKNCVLFA